MKTLLVITNRFNKIIRSSIRTILRLANKMIKLMKVIKVIK